MKIYALRHGHTNYNELGLCNGDPSVDVHLTTRGIRQAEAAAEEMRELPLQRVFVSELPRTRQTADRINRYHKVPDETRTELNDILSGCEGRPVASYQRAIAADPLRHRVEGGESLLDYKQRVVPFVNWLKGMPYETVAVVVHEETMRVLYGYFNHLNDKELPKLAFGNCELVVFEL